MKIAIIGSGISGLVSAYHLHREHDVSVFEANDYIGGHTNTANVVVGGEFFAVDTGFIVFNDWTYPNFIELLDELKVESQPTEMSFSVHDEQTGLEYNGHSLNTLFAQRRNLLSPKFYRMVADIFRFNRQAKSIEFDLELGSQDPMTVGEFLKRFNYSAEFQNYYLLPMGAAIWSCPTGVFADFPIRFIAEFYKNHGLLSVGDRPTWRVIKGGSQSYVRALVRGFEDRIYLNSPVLQVKRGEDTVQVSTADAVEQFDHVIFACHSDQALRIIGANATSTEQEVLREFPYSRNTAVLHTDTQMLPKSRRAWASWNYRIKQEENELAGVTYNMSHLQQIDSPHTFCVTLNGDAEIDPTKILRKYVYNHPVFTLNRAAAQARHAELLNANRTSFCGAYWGNGFHEDGVVSALAVVNALKQSDASNKESNQSLSSAELTRIDG